MRTTLLSRLWYGCAAAIMVIVVAGCYTLVKHPRLATEDDGQRYEHSAAVTYGDDCASCHESNAYVAAHGQAPPPPGRPDRWYYYSEYPWWIPYYTPSQDTEGSGATEQQQRPFGRRNRSADEETQAAQPAAASGSTASPAAPAIARANGDSSQSQPKPAENDGRHDDRRSGDTQQGDNRRERKP